MLAGLRGVNAQDISMALDEVVEFGIKESKSPASYEEQQEDPDMPDMHCDPERKAQFMYWVNKGKEHNPPPKPCLVLVPSIEGEEQLIGGKSSRKREDNELQNRPKHCSQLKTEQSWTRNRKVMSEPQL